MVENMGIEDDRSGEYIYIIIINDDDDDIAHIYIYVCCFQKKNRMISKNGDESQTIIQYFFTGGTSVNVIYVRREHYGLLVGDVRFKNPYQ